MSSQHDEAPARPGESAPSAGPEQSSGSAAAGPGAISPVSFGPEPVGPKVVGAAGFGQAATPGTPASARPPWKAGADGRTVFRRGTPFVVWWIWVAFAIFNLAEIAIPDHDYFSFEVTAGLLTVTAVMYACTLRPRVIADDEGLLVQNPYQDHRIRWGALTGVYLGDSVELTCTRPVPRKDKTVYCWALYSGRRSRLKTQIRADRNRTRVFGGGAASRAHAEADQLARQDIVHLMAAELGSRSTAAKERGAPAAVLESSWSWLPMVYALVPAALLLGLVLGR